MTSGYWINNYLLGNRPPRIDAPYWNKVSTRMPTMFHAALPDTLRQGLALKRNAVKFDGSSIDMGKIATNKFLLAGTTDMPHPGAASAILSQTLVGTNEFVLNSGDHI